MGSHSLSNETNVRSFVQVIQDLYMVPFDRWPGYLDNSVAGGIPSGMSVFESLVKEAAEEASIDEGLTRTLARCAGSISYYNQ